MSGRAVDVPIWAGGLAVVADGLDGALLGSFLEGLGLLAGCGLKLDEREARGPIQFQVLPRYLDA